MTDRQERGVRRTEWLGVPAVRLDNEFLSATAVPAWGARIVSLRSKKAGLELLRVPSAVREYEDAPMLYGIPVLFPPNRIEDGVFKFGGRVYQFGVNDPATGCHSHGLVHDKGWDVRPFPNEGGAETVTLEFVSSRHPDVAAQFPHPFRLVMRLSLEGAALTQTLEIANEGDEPFPWGLGYHTAFRFPFGDGTAPKECELQAPVGRRWELNDRFLPTGRLLNDERSGPLREGLLLDGIVLDDVFQAVPGGESGNEAVLTDRAAGIRVRYRADDAFGQWVLHNGDGRGGFLCPEPYTCVTNAFNLPLPSEVTGLRTLKPGESRVLTCRIAVERV